jgi:hypothetical protein
MSLTFGDFIGKVLRVLGDPDQSLFEDDIIWDGAVAAHEAVLPWIPKYAEHTFTSGSEGVYALPLDCYQIQSVQDVTTGAYLPKATLAPGTARNIDTSYNDWIEYPLGYISLNTTPAGNLRLYYFAFWNAPTSETDQSFVLEVPQMAHLGMIYYAASHCLIPKAVDSAQIRQFNQRMDSGNPEHNPLKVEAKYLLERFYQEMKMMPSYVRVTA